MNEDAIVAQTGMLIRRPVTEVFQAFVDPEITSKFWFTKGSGRTQGFTFVLSGLKALLEHNVVLNLVADAHA
jgi:uncharacterized protein YndB with AHSA1/START domain